MRYCDVCIVGGGAAGFFTAAQLSVLSPTLSVIILEKGKDVLTKVKISGGGRCNVTHAEFDPKPLSRNYPRGERELLGPFHKFAPGDTMAFFEERGVALKTEEDGRIFPVSDSSQSIIDALTTTVKRAGIPVLTKQLVTGFKKEGDLWQVSTSSETFSCRYLVLTTGSNPKVWNWLGDLGHTIIPPVPSLFTFTVTDNELTQLAGTTAEVALRIPAIEMESSGALLITHWGFSGPAVLRLSAWGARELHQADYKFTLEVNWVPGETVDTVIEILKEQSKNHGKKQLNSSPLFNMTKRLWTYMLQRSNLDLSMRWAEVSGAQYRRLSEALVSSPFQVVEKSTFKEEFVTAGGVSLKEIDFRTFESKLLPGVYLAGEVLDIDAITGGFNFQNAWTGGYQIANSIASKTNSSS